MDIKYKFKPNKAIDNIIHESEHLKSLLLKVNKLSKLNQAVLKNLDPDIAQNCRVANLRNGILILATTSPEWNHKLRFLKYDLLENLRTKPFGYGLTSIKIKTIPELSYNTFNNQKPLPKLKTLSTENAELINSLAKNISSTKLSKALRKISKHDENK